MRINKGSESGAYLPPENIPFYKSLLKKTYFLEKEEDIGDENIASFAINNKEDFFDGNPIIKVCLDENNCREIQENLFITILLKEEQTRQYIKVMEKLINFDEDFVHDIFLKKEHFNNFALNSNIHLDVIAFTKISEGLPKIESLKRFNLQFGGIANWFSIESRDEEFFINRKGGPNTLSLTDVVFIDKDELLEKNASEIVKVYINKSCSEQYDRMTAQKNNLISQTLCLNWASNVFTQAALKLLKEFDNYPSEINNENSLAAKTFNLFNITDDISFQEIKSYAFDNPEIIHMKVQDFLEIASIVKDYRGRNK